GNRRLAVREGDHGGGGKGRSTLGVNELRRHHDDEDEGTNVESGGPEAFSPRRPYGLTPFGGIRRRGYHSGARAIFEEHHHGGKGQDGDEEEHVVAHDGSDQRHLLLAGGKH